MEHLATSRSLPRLIDVVKGTTKEKVINLLFAEIDLFYFQRPSHLYCSYTNDYTLNLDIIFCICCFFSLHNFVFHL